MADAAVFAEPGGRWRTVVIGPVICLIVLIAELVVGVGVHLFALTLFAVLLAAFVAVQVLAARRHASVEVHGADLRCGTETVPLADIAELLPAADPDAADLEPWETARALGELSGVPRRRTSIGLRLVDGTVVRAWARDGDGLRAALDDAVARVDRSDRAEGDEGSEA